jgi:cytochrome P450
MAPSGGTDSEWRQLPFHIKYWKKWRDSTKAEAHESSPTEPGGDILVHLLRKDEDGNCLPFEYILLRNVHMFLLTGHGTTTAVLANALWQLAAHSPAQKRLHGEVDPIFEDLEEGAYPSYKEANHLRYLVDAVVRETLRLHPPVAGVARSNIEETGLKKDGREEDVIPKNSAI